MNDLLTWPQVSKLTGVPSIRHPFLIDHDCFPRSRTIQKRFLWFVENIQVWDAQEIKAWCEELKINPKLQWGVKTEIFNAWLQRNGFKNVQHYNEVVQGTRKEAKK